MDLSGILSQEKRKDIFACLCDSGKIFCSSFNRISLIRRNLINPLLDKNIRVQVEKSKPSDFLVGSDVAEKVKLAKSLESTSKDLKIKKPFVSTTVNRRFSMWPSTSKQKIPNQRTFVARPVVQARRGHSRGNLQNRHSGTSPRAARVTRTSERDHIKLGKSLHTSRWTINSVLQKWLLLTSNRVILNWVKGHTIPCIKILVQAYPPSRKSTNHSELQHLAAEIKNLLNISAVARCRNISGQFISNIFLVPKPNGGKRFILNLKHLNVFVYAPHFKMDDARTAVKLIHQSSFACTVDLKDAYYLLPVNKLYRKYFRFSIENCLFEFTYLHETYEAYLSVLTF